MGRCFMPGTVLVRVVMVQPFAPAQAGGSTATNERGTSSSPGEQSG